jgi:hypothetical protein
MMTTGNRKIRPLRKSEREATADGKRHRGLWHGVVTTGQTRVDCDILDLSPGGAKLRMQGEFPFFSTRLWLILDFLGPIPARLAWERDGQVGLRFTPDAPIVRRLATLLAAMDHSAASDGSLSGGDRKDDTAAHRRHDLGIIEGL